MSTLKKTLLGKWVPLEREGLHGGPMTCLSRQGKARQGNVGTPRRCEGLGEAKEVSPSMPKGLPQNKLKQCRSVLEGA